MFVLVLCASPSFLWGVVRVGFWGRWRQGMRDLTPLQILRGKRLAVLGQLFGLLIGVGYVVQAGLWTWLLFLVATFVLLSWEFVSVERQIVRLEGL